MIEKYACWVTLRPLSDHCRRGEAEVRIFDFQTTWTQFQKHCQTTATLGEAELCRDNLKKHHLPRVGPKQLCASAHLGSTRVAGTS